MRRLNKIWALSLATVLSAGGTSAFAQYDENQETGSRSQAMSEDVTAGVFQSPFVLTPQVGVLGFTDGNGNYTSRGIAGLTVEWDAGSTFMSQTPIHVGLESGLLYSHLGGVGSNYFGADGEGFAGNNSVLIPLHITAGYEINDKLLVSALIGANGLYRSESSSMLIGRDDFRGDDTFDVLPSVGLNIGWAVSRSVGIVVRGDYIPVPADDSYTTTLGATIGLG